MCVYVNNINNKKVLLVKVDRKTGMIILDVIIIISLAINSKLYLLHTYVYAHIVCTHFAHFKSFIIYNFRIYRFQYKIN